MPFRTDSVIVQNFSKTFLHSVNLFVTAGSLEKGMRLTVISSTRNLPSLFRPRIASASAVNSSSWTLRLDMQKRKLELKHPATADASKRAGDTPTISSRILFVSSTCTLEHSE